MPGCAKVPVMAFAFSPPERILGANVPFKEKESRAARNLESAMFIYEILLVTGVLGLIAMSLAGWSIGWCGAVMPHAAV